MSQFPEDDRLVEFLRQHRPVPPLPSAALEDAIMTAISADLAIAAPLAQSRQRRRYLWLVPSVIAASLITALFSYRAWLPPQLNATEVAVLEDFMASNWYNTVSENSDNEILPSTNEQ